MKKQMLPPYAETLSDALALVEAYKVIAHKRTFCDREAFLNHWNGGIAYETHKGGNFPLDTPKGAAWLHVGLYRMPSGRYELTAYVH